MKHYAAGLRSAAEVVDVPGAPRTLRLDAWQVDEAWQALLRHLRAQTPAAVQETDDGIRVATRHERAWYRFSPEEWADYLNGVGLAKDDQPIDGAEDVVPAATGPLDELPVWAADELFETVGADGPVVRIVDGRLVGFEE